jgi:hypothetical protein
VRWGFSAENLTFSAAAETTTYTKGGWHGTVRRREGEERREEREEREKGREGDIERKRQPHLFCGCGNNNLHQGRLAWHGEKEKERGETEERREERQRERGSLTYSAAAETTTYTKGGWHGTARRTI